MASATSSKAWWRASGEALVAAGIGASLIVRRITLISTMSQLGKTHCDSKPVSSLSGKKNKINSQMKQMPRKNTLLLHREMQDCTYTKTLGANPAILFSKTIQIKFDRAGKRRA